MNKERSNSIKTIINLVSSIGVLIINLCISFYLSPFIIKNIGVEANGFVQLANTFVGYADLLVTALNAMAARFITIEYVNKNYKKANMYYNSVFWGNLIIVGILIIPAALFVAFMENSINVPSDILSDIRILFTMVFLGFFIRTGAPNYDCGTYVTNRMDLSYIPAMFTAVFRCVFLLCIFTIWKPHVWYVSLTSMIITMITLAIAGYNTHHLTPELKINITSPICSISAMKELVGAGIWNSFSSAGYMLLNGLDLLICNRFIGATMMGILSLSKTLPNILLQLSDSIRGAFGPELTISFAKGDKDNILKCINRAMKITSVIVTIPAAGLVVMSDAFYQLWVPSQDARLLQVLTSLAILSYLINSGVVILFNVFSTVNKVKYNSIAMIVSGVISIIVTFFLIIFTDLDIYAVAGISSIATIFKNLFFTVPVAARLLHFKWYQFYPQVAISTVSCAIISCVGFGVRQFVTINSWGTFILTSGVIGVIGLMINMLLVLNKEERKYFVNFVGRKLHFIKR